MANEQPWVPIESDPEIMTELVQSLTQSNFYLIDVPVIDGAEEMGIFFGHNLKAFIFLYTINEKTEGNHVGELTQSCPAGLYHMKQVNKNACGTVALFHSCLNTPEKQQIPGDSVMGKFFAESSPADFDGRGKIFSSMDSIKTFHEQFASKGQSSLPTGEELNKINYHYVAIVPHDGHVYELDGRRKMPVKHAECSKTDSGFIQAGLGTIQKLIQRDPDNYNFSILGLCKA